MIARQATPTGDPGQGAFDDPSFGDHLKACRLVAVLLPCHFVSLPDPLARPLIQGCFRISTAHPRCSRSQVANGSPRLPWSAHISSSRGKSCFVDGSNKRLPP